MCGYFAFAPDMTGSEINKVLGLTESNESIAQMASYKFTPKSMIPTVSKNSPNKLVMRMWSLIPRWWREDLKDLKFATFNAKSETIGEKATYRSPWKDGNRCLIPATWFYEFESIKENGKVKKKPYRIQDSGEKIIGIAGIYDSWKNREGEEIESCTMLTRESDPPLSKIHKREPVIIEKKDWERWLDRDTSLDEVDNLIKAKSKIEMFPINPEFNKTSPDDVTREMVEKKTR